MLRKLRITLAVVFLLCLSWLFLDFTGLAHQWLGWMAKLQFLPAVLAVNVGVVVFIVALTLFMGRIYCSVICPLGVMQDVFSWISAKAHRKQKAGRFSYSQPRKRKVLRIAVLVIFILALVLGGGTVVQLLAPYSSFGRIMTMLFRPLYEMGNNVLASYAERAESYSFYTLDVWMRSLPVLIIASVTFVALFVMAWIGGRTYCNNLCPVGTVLGYLSMKSFYKVQIDASKCNSCSLCSRNCKASAIDFKNHKVDYTRCVDCFDCLDKCHKGAISFGLVRKAADTAASEPSSDASQGPSRRTFITATATVAATAALHAQQKTVAAAAAAADVDSKTTDGGLHEIIDKIAPERQTQIVPPGSLSIRNLQQHCTGCQLCVSECPNGVLRPSSDLLNLMQPTMSYERGYCRPECTRCSDVCPAGAIIRFEGDQEERRAVKASTKIGRAVWVKDLCVPLVNGSSCGNCARHCPSGAITMVPSNPDDKRSVKIPVIDEERCIGCGACENLCPSRPFSAIYVEGIEVHRTI